MEHEIKPSRLLLETLACRREPAYRIARRAGLHPATLSKLIHGAERVRPNDPRVIAVGRQLGLTADECFDAPAPEDRGHNEGGRTAYAGPRS